MGQVVVLGATRKMQDGSPAPESAETAMENALMLQKMEQNKRMLTTLTTELEELSVNLKQLIELCAASKTADR